MIQIQRSEWRWVCIYAVALSLLLSIPYLTGYASQTPENRFSGALIGIEDLNSYFAKMNQGAHGAWLFTLPYTSEPQQASPVYLFYLLLGKISGTDYFARVVTYHLARMFFGCLLMLVSYRFLAEFLSEPSQRRYALVLVTVGGGLGWLLIILGQSNWLNSLPLEFASPEAYSFLMLLTLPHLLAARCLLLTALLAFLYRKYLWSGLVLLPLGLIQPATVAIAWAVIGATCVITLLTQKDFSWPGIWNRVRPIFVITLVSAAPVLYLGYIYLSDPLVREWNLQNIIPALSPLHYLSGYGVYLILAGFGLAPLKRIRPDLWLLALGWGLLIPVLLNLPIGIQRRLIEGFEIPLVAVAVLGLTSTLSSYRPWLMPLIIFLVLPSSMLLWAGAIQSAQYISEPVFRHQDELIAFGWLDKNAQPKQVVLSAFSTGNALPAYTDLIAFVGHSSETAFLPQKMQGAAAFYKAGTSTNQRLQMLASGRIAYVFYGPPEQALGVLNPSSLPYLKKRFQQGNYAVYEVVSP